MKCKPCLGTGLAGDEIHPCSECEGSGYEDTVEELARDLLARLSFDYGDGEYCPPEVQSLFNRGAYLLPVVPTDKEPTC